MSLAEAIDRTLWIDTHEHLVEERRRLGPEPYVFNGAWGDRICIPDGWTALLAHYAVDDLVSAGLPRAAAHRLVWNPGEPLEQWDAVEATLTAARNTGFLRAVDLTTERLFGRRLSRDTCEEIDAACRALRAPGWYARVLTKAGVERCQVNSLEDDPLCETDQPALLEQDLALYPLVTGCAAHLERRSGIEVGGLDDYLDLVEWCFERFAPHAVAVKLAWAYFRPLAVSEPGAPPRAAFARLRRNESDLADRRAVEDFLLERCIELATEHGLPVKLHLGHLAGTSSTSAGRGRSRPARRPTSSGASSPPSRPASSCASAATRWSSRRSSATPSWPAEGSRPRSKGSSTTTGSPRTTPSRSSRS